jgi:hypothetical protein
LVQTAIDFAREKERRLWGYTARYLGVRRAPTGPPIKSPRYYNAKPGTGESVKLQLDEVRTASDRVDIKRDVVRRLEWKKNGAVQYVKHKGEWVPKHMVYKEES